VSPAVTSQEQQRLAAEARRMLAVYDRARDLIEIGAYAPGLDGELDRAVAVHPALSAFTRQPLHQRCPAAESWQQLAACLWDGPASHAVGPAGGDPR
jgi:flagellum-specific ATP synthase